MRLSSLFFLMLILACGKLYSQETAQWRGANRDGIYNEPGLLASWPEGGPKLLWHFDELGDGHASAAVTRDRIYTTGTIQGKGYVFAFSPDGKLEWKLLFGDEWTESWPGVRSTPLVSGDKLYIMSSFGKLVCMGAVRGNEIWSADLMATYGGQNITWGVTENLLVDGDKLFCTIGGSKNNIIALNKDTGKLLWSSAGNGEKSAYNSPILIRLPGRKILVTMTEKSILGLDAETGRKLWSHEQINQYAVHANSPIYSIGYLYCVSGYGYGGVMLKLADDGSSVSRVWKDDLLDTRMGGAVLVDGKIYGLGDKNKGLHCIDWKTGKETAFDKLNQKGGNIISANGLLYTYDESGEVDLLQPTAAGFTRTGSFKVPFGTAQHWAHSVISNGRLYIRHGNSLMVYDIKAR